ncbi:uncharacterized protein [Paralichthys olivaceus]|uniref:uncharacterized protein n=1 Tax=Paralichthys olivaceus TaxID=8255 RepID=UPI003753B822
MPSTLLCFGVGVVLFSLAPSTMSFSRGASHTSCQEMIPGHIRAQPQDPQHSFVSLRTSASSYLPGQLITVTVRSSRDFMGFLLQARSVEGGGGRAGGRAGVGVRARGGTGVRSTGVGPVVMGGSWTLTPPGTHTLRCLSDGDTLTHSDKQLKRNLSFVWRAPDAPMGDIRFYITVVQSYFVYWAGIESAVVHDGSRRSWSGSKTTKVDGETTTFALQENEAAALPDLRAYSASIQLTETVDPATTTGHSLPRGSGTRSYRSLETVTRPSLETNSSAIGSDHLTNQAVNDRNSTKSSGALPNVTSGSESSGSLSAGTEEAGSDTGSFVAHTEDLKRSIFQSNRFSTAPIPTEEKAAETRLTTSVSPDITVQTSTSPRSLSSVPLLKDVDVERKERMKLQDPKLSILTKMVNTQSTAYTPSTNHSFSNTNAPRVSTHNPTEPIQNSDLKSSLYPRTSSNSFLPVQTSQSKLLPQSFLQSHTISTLSQAPPTLSPNKLYKSVSDVLKSQPENSPSYPQLQTTAPLRSPPQPQPLNSYIQTLPQTIPTQTSQTDQSPSEAPSISPLTQSHSQTGEPQDDTFESTQTQSSAAPRSSNPLLLTSRFYTVFAINEGKEVTNHQSQANIKTTTLIFAIPSITPSPIFSGSTLQSSASSSSPSLPPSALIHPRSTTPLYPSRSSTEVTAHPLLRSTLLTHSSSSSVKNKPKTAPALSALPSPSPISVPPHFHTVQPSLPYPVPFSNSSNYSSPAPLLPPVASTNPSSSPFSSSQLNIGSTFSSPSSSAISSALPSTSSTDLSTSSIPSVSPSPPPLTVTSSSFSLGSSFSTSSPHLRPSPAPLRAPYNPRMSSPSPVPSQKLTMGQSLLIQNHLAQSDPQPNLTPATQRTVVHANPEPHPNLDPNSKLNLGYELKTNLPKTDTKPKRPSNPPGTPDKEGKYPDIIPRHSAWELGMLLGCSAGLGMVLVVGVRYMYRQACGKRTEVTLNDREREYERGERGLIHVQECGDLVRVRRIRENSFVLLAEYDILASPGD